MADAMIGRNVNTNGTATVNAGVALNATTSTTILAANPNRIAIQINNNSSTQAAWIKLQTAATDNVKKGIFLHKKGDPHGEWNMVPDNVYTGEISAIADSGTPTVYVTEY